MASPEHSCLATEVISTQHTAGLFQHVMSTLALLIGIVQNLLPVLGETIARPVGRRDDHVSEPAQLCDLLADPAITSRSNQVVDLTLESDPAHAGRVCFKQGKDLFLYRIKLCFVRHIHLPLRLWRVMGGHVPA